MGGGGGGGEGGWGRREGERERGGEGRKGGQTGLQIKLNVKNKPLCISYFSLIRLNWVTQIAIRLMTESHLISFIS